MPHFRAYRHPQATPKTGATLFRSTRKECADGDTCQPTTPGPTAPQAPPVGPFVAPIGAHFACSTGTI